MLDINGVDRKRKKKKKKKKKKKRSVQLYKAHELAFPLC